MAAIIQEREVRAERVMLMWGKGSAGCEGPFEDEIPGEEGLVERGGKWEEGGGRGRAGECRLNVPREGAPCPRCTSCRRRRR